MKPNIFFQPVKMCVYRAYYDTPVLESQWDNSKDKKMVWDGMVL